MLSYFTRWSSNHLNIYKILRHGSPNKVKHSWKLSRAFAGNGTRVAPVKDQCSNHWAKRLTLWRSCQRLIIYKKLCEIYLMLIYRWECLARNKNKPVKLIRRLTCTMYLFIFLKLCCCIRLSPLHCKYFLSLCINMLIVVQICED